DKNYDNMMKNYTIARKSNADRIKQMDPEKAKQSDLNNPSPHDVIQHGTAPWRIVQLYNSGIAELKLAKAASGKKNTTDSEAHFKLALLYLGAMGHYVGDMGQPFHASLDFDGGAFQPPQTGIHHDY